MAFEWVDILKGAGSILNAGSTFYTGKQQSKIAKEEFPEIGLITAIGSTSTGICK